MKTPWTFVGFAVLALLAGTGCGRKPAAAPAEASARRLAVRTLPAAVRMFERRLAVQGTVEAKRFAQVAARVEGNLEALWVDVGDPVVSGETLLFQIDPLNRSNAVVIAERELGVARAALAVARASVGRVEAEARKAGLDVERFRRLHESGRVSDGEFEQAEVADAQARAGIAVARAQEELSAQQVRQAEAALAVARKHLEDARGLAPLSGVVSERLAEPGEQMAVGRVLLRIDDLSTLEAAAFLPARYHAEVEPGRTRFRLGVNGREAGTYSVTTRAPTVNPVLRTFEVRGLLEGVPAQVVPGVMADLAFVFETRRGLGVPSAAVLTRGGASVVFVVEDGSAVQRTVETGWSHDGWTEVRAGLAEGEAVVVEGQTQLAAGVAVTVL